jgi:hypothetical protein
VRITVEQTDEAAPEQQVAQLLGSLLLLMMLFLMWLLMVMKITMTTTSLQYCDMTPKSRNNEVRTDFIARQRLGRHIPAATNTQATIE